MISTAHSQKVALTIEITEDEFNESLRRSGNDTAPGPDTVRYSDITNLTEEDRTELYDIYQERFDKGLIPEDWTQFLATCFKTRKRPPQAKWTMQYTIGKLMERIVSRKLARDFEDRKIFPTNQGGFRPGECTLENVAAFAYDVYEGFQRREQTLAVAWQSISRTHITGSSSCC